MVLPTFIICGTQKGGTSTLFQYLKEHPEICMSKHKEVHYFDLNYHNNVKWYEKEFIDYHKKTFKAIGEASPFYMYLEEVPERIYNLIPNIKLIFILRNPVDRTYSHYWHEVKFGYEFLSFEDALRKEEERLSKGEMYNKRHFSYKDRGKYAIQLKRFRKFFSPNQMLILIMEELKKHPEEVISRMFDFLEVDTNFKDSDQHVNKKNVGKHPRIWKLQRLKTKIPHNIVGRAVKYGIDTINLKDGYPPINLETRQKLLDYFKTSNYELEKILGKKLDGWYK